jgi:ABC-type amino acid transport substrate-binding protein
MTDTVPREKLFDFTPSYYYTPAGIAVASSNTSIQDLSTDLDGKKICVGSSTTYEDYLEGNAGPRAGAPKFDFVIDNPPDHHVQHGHRCPGQPGPRGRRPV